MRPDVNDAVKLSDADHPINWGDRRLLAEGDSWFTTGSLLNPTGANLLTELDFASGRRFSIVSCAYPGDELQKMVKFWEDPWFEKLLSGPNPISWDGVLLSAGGNDLISAAQVSPVDRNGNPRDLDCRILLTPAEAQQGPAGPARYISEAGWARLAGYLNANFKIIADERDKGPNAGRPIFLHTYAIPTVRPSGALPWSRGWLFEAFETAGIPAADRQAVSDLLFDRFRQLLLALDDGSQAPTRLPNVHVFDSAAVPIVKADPGATGRSGDWENEIHLTRSGYQKVGRSFGAFMDARVP